MLYLQHKNHGMTLDVAVRLPEVPDARLLEVGAHHLRDVLVRVPTVAKIAGLSCSY